MNADDFIAEERAANRARRDELIAAELAALNRSRRVSPSNADMFERALEAFAGSGEGYDFTRVYRQQSREFRDWFSAEMIAAVSVAIPDHVVRDGEVHFLTREADGSWYVTTRKNGRAFSGMPLDRFLQR